MTIVAAAPASFAGSRTAAFTCHGCGDCCKGSAILLSPFDLARLAALTKESPRSFVRERCVVLKHPLTSLPAVMLETVPQCTFLDDANRCTAYNHRPLVCRSYPLGIFTDLNEPGWRPALSRFTIRANPCPPPNPGGHPLPMVNTLHAMATSAGMEPYAEAYRTWARLTEDIANNWRYAEMEHEEAQAFDAEFRRTFFDEVDHPEGEREALGAFLKRASAFRARHRIPAAGELSTPPAATTG